MCVFGLLEPKRGIVLFSIYTSFIWDHTTINNNISTDTLATAGLSNIPGFTIASHPESPIVYLRLKKSTGSLKDDLHLLENIAERVRNADQMFIYFFDRTMFISCFQFCQYLMLCIHRFWRKILYLWWLPEDHHWTSVNCL
jgi:hypothetical protein